MSIIFEIKGKQCPPYFPEKKDQTFRIDYQKNTKPGDKIVFKKILAILAKDADNDEFGQPYLNKVKLVGEIVKHGQNAKITGMKYKPKKRNKKKWGFRQQYTEVKIVSVEGN